ncbi:MAG: ATP-binding protein [Bryobacteraceae bacterium]
MPDNKARFRFSTDILRRLGEELNPSLEHGIVELAKNSYDADATKFTVVLANADKPGGSVVISDNGTGMTPADIRDGWLVLGQSRKSSIKRTPGGRIPAGYKGLGRLAALRLGSVASVKTRPRTPSDAEYHININWKDFDTATLVEQVDLLIDERKRRSGSTTGTDITITRLRAGVSRAEVRRLARELILLADPFGQTKNSFTPVLVAPEFDDIAKIVETGYLVDADFHLKASVAPNGRASAAVLDWKGKELFKANHKQLAERREGAPYGCPPATFDFWAFLLKAETFLGRNSKIQDVRAWLDAVGGVHLYQNELRVSPYGNPGNDWLDINLRRAQSPEERPSTNNSIGKISVLDENFKLIQKTDRSGFIETEAFKQLREFAQDALEWMARERLAVANKRREQERKQAPEKADKAKAVLEKAISAAPKPAQARLRKAMQAYDSQKEKEVGVLRKEVQLYRTLSTAGITAATFAHESSGNPIKVIQQSINAIQRRGKQQFEAQYDTSFAKPVDAIIRSIDTLGVLSTATLSLIDHDKRRMSRVDLHHVINNVVKMFDPFFKGRDVELKLNLDAGSPFIRGSEAAFESILTNLINNSVSAFELDGTKNRTLRISTTIEDDTFTLAVADNGPGITGIAKRNIWLPGQTTKPHGTGLGLTIVRDTVIDLSGSVDADEHCDLGGAEILVSIPLVGK